MNQAERELVALSIPIAPGRWVYFQSPLPMTPVEWRNLLAILDTFRLGLVAELEQSDEPR